jgi:hypothetical protein
MILDRYFDLDCNEISAERCQELLAELGAKSTLVDRQVGDFRIVGNYLGVDQCGDKELPTPFELRVERQGREVACYYHGRRGWLESHAAQLAGSIEASGGDLSLIDW